MYEGGVFIDDEFQKLEEVDFDVGDFVVIVGEFLFGDEVVDEEMHGLGEVFIGEELEGLGRGMIKRRKGRAESHKEVELNLNLLQLGASEFE
jgi:hypothetical protein